MENSPTILPSMFCALSLTVFMAALALSAGIKIVPEGQRLEVYRLGRYIGRLGPGLVMVIPIIDKAIKVDAASPEQEMVRAACIPAGIASGRALTPIQPEGEVEIDGRMWHATSAEPIPSGAQVRVRRVVVEVEKT